MRYGKTKIRARVRDLMDDWMVPKYEKEPYRAGTIEFTILRHNNRRLDADSAVSVGKMIMDFIVDRGYFIDESIPF
jgi:hypothetical protein